MAAVQDNGWALTCSSDELREDSETIAAAVEQNSSDSKYALGKFWADHETARLFLAFRLWRLSVIFIYEKGEGQ